ncbi:MAG: hypothetical protein K8S23_06280 [Candidatus Cloacimonetes bacterium]|nr:hypothetical protein [Candidatus Cloacimonadota bacterium]
MKKIFIIVILILLMGCGPDMAGKTYLKLRFEYLFVQGVDCYDSKEYNKAIGFFVKASQTNPNNEEVYLYISASNRELEQYKEALVALEMAIQINPIDDNIARRGLIYARIGEDDNSIKDFQSLSKDHNLDKAQTLNYAWALSRKKFHKKALDVIDKAIDIDPIHQYYFFKYQYFIGINDYEEALIEINKAILQSPLDDYIARRGSIYSVLYESEKAINDYQAVYDRFPLNDSQLSNYFGALSEKERYEEALEIINFALLTDSLNVRYILEKGIICSYMKNFEDAIPIFRKTLEIVNNSNIDYSTVCYYFLSTCYYRLDDYEVALIEIDLCLNKYNQNKGNYSGSFIFD